MYQVISRNMLCRSKKYFDSLGMVNNHIRIIIAETQKYYAKQERRLHPDDIAEGIVVTSIDQKLLPEWKKIFGPEKEIRAPYTPETDNIEKKYVKEKKDVIY